MLCRVPFADLHVGVRLPRCVTNAAFDTLFDTLTDYVGCSEQAIGAGGGLLSYTF